MSSKSLETINSDSTSFNVITLASDVIISVVIVASFLTYGNNTNINYLSNSKITSNMNDISNVTSYEYNLLNNEIDLSNYVNEKPVINFEGKDNNAVSLNLDFSKLKFFKNNEELKKQIGDKQFNKIHEIIEDQLNHRKELLGVLPKIIKNISNIKD